LSLFKTTMVTDQSLSLINLLTEWVRSLASLALVNNQLKISKILQTLLSSSMSSMAVRLWGEIYRTFSLISKPLWIKLQMVMTSEILAFRLKKMARLRVKILRTRFKKRMGYQIIFR